MLKCFLVFSFSLALVSSQTWVSRGNLKNHVAYWQNLMQELINELERREWCNLKLNDITQNIDDNLFNLYINGTVSYTEGFVVSIQRIDTVDIQQLVNSRTIDGEAIPFGTVRGKLNFNDILVGYDVNANLESPKGEYRSTGTFLHTLVQLQLDVTQNLLTKEITSSPSVVDASDGSGVRMRYLPSSNITEALSRRFSSSTLSSAGNWGRQIIAPILVDLATNKLGFPSVCFNNC